VEEDADLGDVSRVEADRDRAPDVVGQDGVEVAQALKADPVAVHDPRGGNRDQEHVERLEALRGAR